jgi:hypothetical protein
MENSSEKFQIEMDKWTFFPEAASLLRSSYITFGFSIGDVITLAQLTTRTYNGLENSPWGLCQYYERRVQPSVTHIQGGSRNIGAKSGLRTQPDDLCSLKTLFKRCHSFLAELERILNKYGSLEKSRRKNWERMRFSSYNLDYLRSNL